MIYDKIRLDNEIKANINKNITLSLQNSIKELNDIGIPIQDIRINCQFEILFKNNSFVKNFIYNKQEV